MNTPKIELLTAVTSASLQFVFVDDCFFAPPEWPYRYKELEKRAIREDDIEFFRDGNARLRIEEMELDTSEAHWLNLLLDLRDGCNKRGVNFAIANFEYLETFKETGPANDDCLFLVDVNYENREGDLGSLYGFRLVRNWYKKRKDLVRFCSRLPTVCFVDERGFNATRDLGIQPNDMFTILNRDGILRWVDSFLFHADQYIGDALRFFSQPWESNTNVRGDGWEHDRLSDPTDGQTLALAEWLEMDANLIVDDAAKALLAVNPSNNPPCLDRWATSYDGYREAKPINGQVLAAACRKLGLNLALDVAERYHLPCQPALQFLIALRSLIRISDVNHEKMRLVKHSGKSGSIYMLHIPFNEIASTDSSKKNGFDLATKVCAATPQDVNDPVVGHTLTNHLIWWMHCKTKLTEVAKKRDWLKSFETGSERPIVALEFHKNAVNGVWTGS